MAPANPKNISLKTMSLLRLLLLLWILLGTASNVAATAAELYDCAGQTGCGLDLSATLEQVVQGKIYEYCTDSCCNDEQECYDGAQFVGCAALTDPQGDFDCCPLERFCNDPSFSYCVPQGDCCGDETACYNDHGEITSCKAPGECCEEEKSCSDGGDHYCVAQDDCCLDDKTCFDDNGEFVSCISSANCCENERQCTDTGGFDYCVSFACCPDEVTCVLDNGALHCLQQGECCPGEDQCDDGTCVQDKEYPGCECGGQVACGMGGGFCVDENDPYACNYGD